MSSRIRHRQSSRVSYFDSSHRRSWLQGELSSRYVLQSTVRLRVCSSWLASQDIRPIQTPRYWKATTPIESSKRSSSQISGLANSQPTTILEMALSICWILLATQSVIYAASREPLTTLILLFYLEAMSAIIKVLCGLHRSCHCVSIDVHTKQEGKAGW